MPGQLGGRAKAGTSTGMVLLGSLEPRVGEDEVTGSFQLGETIV